MLLPAQSSPLAGDWSGTLEAGAARLRLVLHVAASDSGLTAKLDSVDQGAMGIPVTTVSEQGGQVRLELRPLSASFEGRFNKEGTEIAGEWSQGGAALPLVFKRSSAEKLARPQEPKKPYPYREEEVVVENKAGGVKLAGTLTLPNGQGPFPAVILLTGSGSQDRNESVFGHRPFLVLADHLTRQGLAVLRTDDRGAGGSTGSLGASSYEDLTGDALASIEFLKARKEIDAKRIGLAGHSEGSAIGILAAGRSAEVTFLALIAGPGVSGEKLMYEQSKTIARLPGGGERAAALNRKLQEAMFAAVKRGAAEKELREAIQAFAAAANEEDRALASKMAAAGDKQVPFLLSPAFRSLLMFDPAPALAKVRCPLLALFGERDSQVPPALNLAPLAAALEASGNADYSITKLPALNHLFQTSKTGLPTEYAAIEETFAPAALNAISAWVLNHTK
ncbi:MAG: alpha/beta hydrolase [Acidobacteria bacterium]|nr:alpha/beta hydrolase [Acidobacteriota bacterium]